MLRIAVQSKGRLFEDTMALFTEADIKLSTSKRTSCTVWASANAVCHWLFTRKRNTTDWNGSITKRLLPPTPIS